MAPTYDSSCSYLLRLGMIVSLLWASSVPLMSSESAQQFTVQPESVEQAEGLEAVFECQYMYPGAEHYTYTWKINEQFIQGDELRVKQPSFTNDTAKLIVPAIAAYNSSSIMCLVTARLANGTYSSATSMKAVLTIYRIEVITGDLPIISASIRRVNFYVDVYSKFNTSSEHMCARSYYVSGNEFQFECDGYDVCDRWWAVITPTVRGRNGTPSETVEVFLREAKGRSEYIAVIDQARKMVTFSVKAPNCTTFTSCHLNSDSLVTPVNCIIGQPSDDTVSITFSLPTDTMTEVTVTLTDVHGVNLVFENVSIIPKPTTTHNNSEPSTKPPSTPELGNVQAVVIVAVVVSVVFVLSVVAVIVVVAVVLLVRFVRRRLRRKHKKLDYKSISSSYPDPSGKATESGRSTEPERYIKLEPLSAQLDNKVPRESGDNPSPQYETVASARTGTTSPTTADPPPLPPPKFTEDPDAPPLPPPLDPESSTNKSVSTAPPLPPRSEPETSASMEESVRSDREPPILPPPIDSHELVRLDRETPPLPPPLETSSEEGGATLTEQEMGQKPTTKLVVESPATPLPQLPGWKKKEQPEEEGDKFTDLGVDNEVREKQLPLASKDEQPLGDHQPIDQMETTFNTANGQSQVMCNKQIGNNEQPALSSNQTEEESCPMNQELVVGTVTKRVTTSNSQLATNTHLQKNQLATSDSNKEKFLEDYKEMDSKPVEDWKYNPPAAIRVTNQEKEVTIPIHDNPSKRQQLPKQQSLQRDDINENDSMESKMEYPSFSDSHLGENVDGQPVTLILTEKEIQDFQNGERAVI